MSACSDRPSTLCGAHFLVNLRKASGHEPPEGSIALRKRRVAVGKLQLGPPASCGSRTRRSSGRRTACRGCPLWQSLRRHRAFPRATHSSQSPFSLAKQDRYTARRDALGQTFCVPVVARLLARLLLVQAQAATQRGPVDPSRRPSLPNPRQPDILDAFRSEAERIAILHAKLAEPWFAYATKQGYTEVLQGPDPL